MVAPHNAIGPDTALEQELPISLTAETPPVRLPTLRPEQDLGQRRFRLHDDNHLLLLLMASARCCIS